MSKLDEMIIFSLTILTRNNLTLIIINFYIKKEITPSEPFAIISCNEDSKQ